MRKEIMNLRPASTEVLDEFERVRERFLTEFDPADHPSIETTKRYLGEHGLYMHPTVKIPFDAPGFAAARAVATETKYPLPFVYERFPENMNFSQINGHGRAFSTPSYRLNVIQDISERAAETWGEEFANRTASTTFAHEVAHSIFHEHPSILMTVQHGSRAIYEQYPLSGMLHRVYDDQKRVRSYMPTWTEEAFAAYVAADIFKAETAGRKGHLMNSKWFGDDDFWLESQYLAYAPQWPDHPGTIGGAIAGQSLEILDARIPGTIEDMFGIAKDIIDEEQWRTNLRKKIGQKLFGMLFKRHPYTSWTTIHRSIIDLPS